MSASLPGADDAPRSSLRSRALSGVVWGALIGLGVFVADLIGAFAAIGEMFISTSGAWILLACAAACATVAGAVVGAAWGVVWPRRWPGLTSLGTPRSRGLMALFIGAVIASGGYLLRVERNVHADEPRPVAKQTFAPVLWIVLDTLRADALYGADDTMPHSPNLRALAQRGFRFTNAESSAGWTTPSMMTLLTGIHHTALGGSITTLPDWATTIAEHLRAAGYATFAVVDNPILDPRNGFAQGLEGFSFRSPFRFAFSSPWFRLLPYDLREWLRFEFYVAYAGAEDVTRRAVEIIETQTEAPLFLWTHYMDPHGPYYTHDGSAPRGMPRGTAGDAFWRARDRLREVPPGPPPDAATLSLWWHHYLQEIAFMDAHLGRLIEAWQRVHGDRGVIVVTSDHGEEFNEHHQLSHGNSVFRQAVHVPLILVPPGSLGLPKGVVLDHPVGHHGLVPTTLDLAGIGDHDLGDAHQAALLPPSWRPWLEGRGAPPAGPLFANQGRNGAHATRWRDGAWVLVQMDYYDGRPKDQFVFDLTRDPTEQLNLLESSAERADTMVREMGARYRALNEQGQTQGKTSPPTDLDALRAVGYIQ